MTTLYNSVSLRYGILDMTEEVAKWRALAGSENEQDFVLAGNYTSSEGVGGPMIRSHLSLHVDAPFCGKKVIGFLALKPKYSENVGSNGNNSADPYFKEKLEVYSLGRINMNQHGLITKD